MATYAVDTLISSVSTLLQDSTNVRWTVNELVQWLNDGQREIASVKPNAFTKNVSITLVEGTKQTLPVEAISLVDIVRNMGANGTTPGNAVRVVSRELLDSQVPDWHTAAKAATVVKHYMYAPLDPKVFYVYPPQPATPTQVEAVYVASPTNASAGGNITLEDTYASALIDYVLYRAWSKDAEYAGNAQLSGAYFTSFQSKLGTKTAAEVVTNPNQGLGPRTPDTPGSDK